MRPSTVTCAMLLAALLWFGPATASDSNDLSESNETSLVELAGDVEMEPGWLPALGALVPVAGSGHFLGGDSDTGWTLLAIQGTAASILSTRREGKDRLTCSSRNRSLIRSANSGSPG